MCEGRRERKVKLLTVFFGKFSGGETWRLGIKVFLGVCMKNLLISELRVSLRSPSPPLTDSFFPALALTQSHTFDLTICLAHTQRRSTLTKTFQQDSKYFFVLFQQLLSRFKATAGIFFLFFPGTMWIQTQQNVSSFIASCNLMMFGCRDLQHCILALYSAEHAERIPTHRELYHMGTGTEQERSLALIC